MGEPKDSKYLPQVIDVEPIVEEVIHDEQEHIDAFELREPEDEVNTQQEEEIESYQEDYTQRYIDVEEAVVEMGTDKISADTVQEAIYEEDTTSDTKVNEEKQAKDHATDNDTSFRTFKAKQMASEKRWRERTWAKMKKYIWNILGVIVLIPALVVSGMALGGTFVGAAVAGIALIIGGVVAIALAGFVSVVSEMAFAQLLVCMSLAMIGAGGLVAILFVKAVQFICRLWLKGFDEVRSKMRQEAM